MNTFTYYLIMFFMIFVMPAYGIYLLRKTWKNVKEWTYYVHFKEGVRRPDLTAPVFQEFFQVEHITADGTVVITSKVNDTHLAKLISKECLIPLGEFNVTDHIVRMPH